MIRALLALLLLCASPAWAVYSSIGTQLDECLTAPTGFQDINCPTGLTSIAADSVVDQFNDASFITLGYDAQTANFEVGRLVVGGTSGAYGIVEVDSDGGTTGTLTIDKRSGTFQDDEALTDSGGGAAVVNGAEAAYTDIATGDVLRVPTEVDPGAVPESAEDDLTVGLDGHFSYGSVSGRQSALDGLIYDVTAAGYMTLVLDVWANNAVPGCGDSETIALAIDEAMSSIDLSGECSDIDGDTLTFGKVDTDALPTGISLDPDTGIISGTPTVENESGVAITFAAVDVPKDIDTKTYTIHVIDTLPLFDCTTSATTYQTCDAGIRNQFFDDITINPSFQTDCEVASGDVISTDPAASTETALGATVSLVVSSGCPSGGGTGTRLRGLRMRGI